MRAFVDKREGGIPSVFTPFRAASAAGSANVIRATQFCRVNAVNTGTNYSYTDGASFSTVGNDSDGVTGMSWILAKFSRPTTVDLLRLVLAECDAPSGSLDFPWEMDPTPATCTPGIASVVPITDDFDPTTVTYATLPTFGTFDGGFGCTLQAGDVSAFAGNFVNGASITATGSRVLIYGMYVSTAPVVYGAAFQLETGMVELDDFSQTRFVKNVCALEGT